MPVDYARLNLIGEAMPSGARVDCGVLARTLRVLHRRLARRLTERDELLELADQLDTLAHPVVVESPKKEA